MGVQFGYFLVSSLSVYFSFLGRVYSRQTTVLNCVRFSMSLVMKYCPSSTTLRNPASIQNLLNLSCCDSFSIRSPQCCNRNFLRWINTIQKNFCLDRTELEWRTWLSHHNGSSRSLVKGFILFTYLCDCSVKTKLVCINNYAKNSLNRFLSDNKVYRQFSTNSASELTSWQWTCSTEKLDIRSQRIPKTFFLQFCPKFFVDCLLW